MAMRGSDWTCWFHVLGQGWGRTGLSRAASTGAVDDIAVARPDFGGAARSKSMVRFMCS